MDNYVHNATQYIISLNNVRIIKNNTRNKDRPIHEHLQI